MKELSHPNIVQLKEVIGEPYLPSWPCCFSPLGKLGTCLHSMMTCADRSCHHDCDGRMEVLVAPLHSPFQMLCTQNWANLLSRLCSLCCVHQR